MPKFGYVILKYILSLILKYFMFFFRKEQAEKKGKKLNHNDGAGGDEFLTVNLEKMLLMLNNVFTLPRSYRSMEGLRTAASDYISQKLGNLGLIVGIQYFFPSRFYHQVIYFYLKTEWAIKSKKSLKMAPSPILYPSATVPNPL